MESVIQKKTFLKGFCWSDVSHRKERFRACMQTAGYYRVYRCDSRRPDSESVYVWMCEKHKKVAEKAGYICIGVKYEESV